jgi:hypothetical protein
MTITLTLAPELEFKLKQEADRRGLPPVNVPPSQLLVANGWNRSPVADIYRALSWLTCGKTFLEKLIEWRKV